MPTESVQDRSVVLAVVLVLGAVALVGLTGVIWLVHDKVDGTSVAIVTGLVGPAIGGLVGILASTKTGASVNAAAEAVGYQKAVAAVNALGDAGKQPPVGTPSMVQPSV